jgi:signal transduction histidine kinase
MYEKIGVQKLTMIEVAKQFSEGINLKPHPGVEIVNEAAGLSVLADSMLQQLFYNLIDNSLKHGKKVSKIHLYYILDKMGTKLLYEDDV